MFKELFFVEELQSMQTRHYKDNILLLKPSKGDYMYEILKGEEEWMGELFESIMEWILDIPINNKLIWIRIKGLP